MNEMTLLVNAARTDPVLRDAALAVEKRLLEADRAYETAERAAVMWMDRAERAEATNTRLREALDIADDLLRRLSEWDVLNLDPGSGDDGPYWQGEIARVRAALAQDAEQATGSNQESDGASRPS